MFFHYYFSSCSLSPVIMLDDNFDSAGPILQFTVLDAIAYLVDALRDQQQQASQSRELSVKLQICRRSSSFIADDDVVTAAVVSPRRDIPEPSPATHSTSISKSNDELAAAMGSSRNPPVATPLTPTPSQTATPRSSHRGAVGAAQSALHMMWETTTGGGGGASSRLPRSAPLALSSSPSRRGGSRGEAVSSPSRRETPRRHYASPAKTTTIAVAASATPLSQAAQPVAQHHDAEPEEAQRRQPLSPSGNPQPWQNTVKVKRDAYGIIVESPRAQWFKTRSQRRWLAANHVDEEQPLFCSNRISAGELKTGRISDVSTSDDEVNDDVKQSHHHNNNNNNNNNNNKRRGASSPRASPLRAATRGVQSPARHGEVMRATTVSPAKAQDKQPAALLHPIVATTEIQRVPQVTMPVMMRHEQQQSQPRGASSDETVPHHHFGHLAASKQISPPHPNAGLNHLHRQSLTSFTSDVVSPSSLHDIDSVSLRRAQTLESPSHHQRPTTSLLSPPPPAPLASHHQHSTSTAAAPSMARESISTLSSPPPPHRTSSTNTLSSPPPLHPSTTLQSPKKISAPSAAPVVQQLKSLKAMASEASQVVQPSVEPYQNAMRHPLLQQYL
jgi:hypothetical protein